MGSILRTDKPKPLQSILCFFNLYHPYKYWSAGDKYTKYIHVRRCTRCNKTQSHGWYQAGCNLIAYPWEKIIRGSIKEPI